MFWRFGFHNGSSIDSLLDKEDVSLEAILDEDDLLQECKAQNTRLIDYFQRSDVLQRLLGYVTGQIEGEDRGRFKYPYVATEVLCSEIWSIVETCLNNTDQLLVPFWETVLDRTPEDMKTRMTMASQFAKINAVFLGKKPSEMLKFIRAQRDIIERILQHIEMPSFADLLVRIVQLDDQPAGAGVLEWLSDEHLMMRLVGRLSPAHSPDMHVVVAELIKGIISMSASSPAAGLSEGFQTGLASNRFARELASRENVQILVDHILYDFKDISTDPSSNSAPEDDELITQVPPNYDSATSSIVNSICMVIELIRQNNSDYFEPYLFHTLRNRLIHVQQQLSTRDPEEGRVALEGAMKEMVDRIGVVHLGPLLGIFCDRLHELKPYLLKPRSSDGHISTTVGSIPPLTFERFRICELYAELLHCSNMSLLNRSADYDYLYDSEGRLQGGLSALEELAQVITMGSGDEDNRDNMDEVVDETEPALEFPIHGAPQDSSSLLDSDEDMSDDEGPGSFEDDPMEDITGSGELKSTDGGSKPKLGPSHSRSPAGTGATLASLGMDAATPSGTAPPRRKSSNQSIGSDGSTVGRRSAGSRRSSKRLTLADSSQSGLAVPAGERLKHRMLDDNILATILDLFFEFPWNNFLHSVVYDLIHQILTGRVDGGANRLLAISLFRDAKLMGRIVEGQKLNDVESAKPKGVRLGYMGHLTLISEDVITTLDHFPPDLKQVIEEHAPQPAWDDYVRGRYKETRKKDTSLLGGGKPTVIASLARPAGQWKVDEEDTHPSVPVPAVKVDQQETKGEFRRATGSRPALGSTADFGAAPAADDDDDDFTTATHPTFAQYLAREMQRRDEFGGSSSSSDASDEEDGGWLAQSQFEIRLENPEDTTGRPSVRERRPLSEAGLEGAFPQPPADSPFNDPFSTEEEDDDGFGPFSDSAAASRSDPFNLSSSFSDDIPEVSFDSFGDFGDFHSGGDGETTPTAGSWTFTSGSGHSSPSDPGSSDEKDTDAQIDREA